MLKTIAAFRPHRRGKRLRRARPRQCAGGARPRHHQSRHRPARFPHAGIHCRGGDQGAARRSPRLHAGERHSAAARGGRRRSRTSASRSRSRPDSVMIMPGGKPTMYMSILMFGEPGAEIMYPDPGFPIYRSMIEFTGAKPIPGADPRGERLCLLRGRNAEADHAEDAAVDRQLAGQSDRRRHRQDGGRQARRRPRQVAGRGDHVGRDLRSHALRRRDACLPAHLSRDPRPADPAQRLVEDIRDDRLAPRLCGVAGETLQLRAQARREPLFLRECADAICRARGARKARRTK